MGKNHLPQKELIKKEVKRALKSQEDKPERKIKIFDQDAVGVNTTGAINCITSISQGVTIYDRVGVKVRLKEFQLRCYIECNTASGAESFNILRMIIFKWKPLSNPLPTSQELLQTLTDPMTSGYNDDFYNRPNGFKVLHDKLYPINYYGEPHAIICKTWKQNQQVEFKIGATDHTNGIFIFVVSDSTTGSLLHPQLQYQSKIFFTDE